MISSLTAEMVVEHPAPGVDVLVRKAVMSDIAPILELINAYAAQGIMLPRTEFELSENIRDFSVALIGHRLVGCGALHFYSPTAGEIRSLAVHESAKTHGIGRRLVEALVQEAQSYALEVVFAFTYVVEFFKKIGFEEVERGLLPLKAWKDCLRCPKFQCCDEVAVMRVLSLDFWGDSSARMRGEDARRTALEGLIQLPIPQKIKG
jgi:amino-acid N-acetyltransferase